MTTQVLIVDDDLAFARVLSLELESRGFSLRTAGTGKEAVEKVAAQAPQVVLLDLKLPDANGLEVLERLREAGFGGDVIMLTGHGTIDTAIQAIRLGAFDYVSKPCPTEELEIRINKALERQELVQRTKVLESHFAAGGGDRMVLGQSPVFEDALRRIERVAPTHSTVLILGETGVGKEMVARRVHEMSARADKPFVVVECAALHEELLQSELFGHERGAYTGAVKTKPGLFEVAHGGTLFLDEIGEVPLPTQVKLLRVLEASTFRRVGGTQELKVDVRVLAATHRNLDLMVKEGRFREDLLYRLDTFRVEVPPLRQRPQDVAALAVHFIARLQPDRERPRTLSPEALRVMQEYAWPGNVRELLNVVEHAVIVSDDVIRREHLPRNLRAPQATPADRAGPAAASSGNGDGELLTLRELELQHMIRVLNHVAGRRAQAARVLGISERNLYRKLREYGLS